MPLFPAVFLFSFAVYAPDPSTAKQALFKTLNSRFPAFYFIFTESIVANPRPQFGRPGWTLCIKAPRIFPTGLN